MRVRTDRTRLASRLIIAIALLASLLVVAAGPADAHHCTGDGNIFDGGGNVAAECHGNTPGRPGTSNQRGLWAVYCADGGGEFPEGADLAAVVFKFLAELSAEEVAAYNLDPTGVYGWYDVLCLTWDATNGEWTYFDNGSILIEDQPPIPPEVLRDRAAARIVPPTPSPETSPPLTRTTFVQIPTWLWLDPASWVTITESETQGFTTVTVTATPVEAVWVMGDGETAVCDGPGVAWTPGAPDEATDCAHTYRHSTYGEPEGRFAASVTVTWEFEWWINDRYQGVFGDLDLSTSFAVAVAEIQAVESGG